MIPVCTTGSSNDWMTKPSDNDQCFDLSSTAVEDYLVGNDPNFVQHQATTQPKFSHDNHDYDTFTNFDYHHQHDSRTNTTPTSKCPMGHRASKENYVANRNGQHQQRYDHHATTSSPHMTKVFVELTDKIELDIPQEMWDQYHNRNSRNNDTNGNEEEMKQENDNEEWLLRDMILDYIWQEYSDILKRSFHIKSRQEKSTVEKQNHRLNLFDKCTKLQNQFLLKEEPKVVFGNLLECLLDVMDSEYGFIGEVKYEAPENGGAMYLQTHAITNIAWNAATRQFYEDNIEFGLKFTNLQSLFGAVMTSGQCIIANEPHKHPSRAGIPDGHPSLNHFLGIPFFLQGGKELNGMVGISNKPGGYTQEDVEFLQPLIVTCSNLIQAFRINRENEFFTNKLEELVAVRTKELERANLKIVEAAKMQMEHFACMSHEIRTPLNCIVGLSALLVQDATLSAYQKDSITMISKSGELLTAVVNDVLDYAKLETDNMTIDITYVSLQDTLDAVVHSIENKANEKNLTLKTFYDPTIPPYIHTDSRRLQQILYNLLGNAIKFSRSFEPKNDRDWDEDKASVELHLLLIPDDNYNELDRTDNLDKPSSDLPLRTSKDDDGKTCSSTDADNERATLSEDRKAEEQNEPREKTSVESFSGCPGNQESLTLVECNDPQPLSSSLNQCPFVKIDQDPNYASLETRFNTRSNDSAPQEEEKATTGRVSDDQSKNVSMKTKFKLRFLIKDYGKGIAKEDFGKIFEPFQQAASKTLQVQEGTGLGLAITTRLVNGLGGNISVDSELGKWSEFTVDLPFWDEPIDYDCDPQYNDVNKHSKFENVKLYFISENKDPDGPIESKIFGNIASIKLQQHLHIAEYTDCVAMQKSVDFPIPSNGSGKNCEPSQRHRDKIHVLFMHEDSYEKSGYKQLSLQRKTAMITYGPKYSLKESDRHFRSINKTLPSVLLQTIVTCVDIVNARMTNNQKDFPANGSSSPAFHNKETSQDYSKVEDEEDVPIEYDKLVVLIAEDNVINQKVLLRVLNRVGVVNVDIVNDGKKAVDQSAAKYYDVIFMDMQMPVMSGVEATEIIVQRNHASSSLSNTTSLSRKPLIVFVTAHATTDYETMALSAGGDGFISKPFNLDAIRSVLDKAGKRWCLMQPSGATS